MLNYRQIIRKAHRNLVLILIAGILVTFSGCSILRVNNPENKVKKQQKKENEKLKKAYQADVKDHYKKQTKETRKRMNKNLNKVNKDFKRKTGKSKWKCS